MRRRSVPLLACPAVLAQDACGPVMRLNRVSASCPCNAGKYAAIVENLPQRKHVVHHNISGHAHLLTFSCYRRMALLTNDAWRSGLSVAIDRAFENTIG